MNNDFYIGYEKKLPFGMGKFIALSVACIFLIAFSVMAFLIPFKRPFHSGVSSGKYVTLKGVFEAEPYPILWIKRLGNSVSDANKVSGYYVAPVGKKGFGKKALKWDNKYISLGGKLIYRDDQVMVVTKLASFKVLDNPVAKKRIQSNTFTKTLGNFELKGEIVDSKCYLGQMNHGEGKIHKACASLCIRGGLHPLFVLHAENIQLHKTYILLASENNRPVNQDILNIVAEPIQIAGKVIQKNNIYILKANPSDYKRLSTL